MQHDAFARLDTAEYLSTSGHAESPGFDQASFDIAPGQHHVDKVELADFDDRVGVQTQVPPFAAGDPQTSEHAFVQVFRFRQTGFDQERTARRVGLGHDLIDDCPV